MSDTPVMGEDILAAAEAWRREGEEVALATVVETWGSSSRPPGSRLAVSGSGRLAGSVSGGCIEGAVAEVAHPYGVVVQCQIDEEMPCGTGLCGSCEVPVQTPSGARHTIRCCTEGAVLRADRVRWPLYLQDLG